MVLKNGDDSSSVLEEKRLLLQQFRSAISDILTPEHDDRFLIRFLKSRDFDLKKTENMLRESIKYQRKVGVEGILNSNYEIPMICENYFETKFLGFDMEGSPIRTFPVGIFDFKGLAHGLCTVDWARFFAFYLAKDYKNALERSKETGCFQDKSVYIADARDFAIIRQFCDKTVIQKGIQLITMYQDNYPELLKICYIINAPPYFNWVLNIFKPFIHERTMRKLRIRLADSNWKEEMLRHIDPDILPKYYGGNLDIQESNSRIQLMANPNAMKVPLKYYLKDEMSLHESDPGIKCIIIKKGSVFDYKVDVETPGTVLKWLFQTKDYNVKFGVLFQNTNQLKSKKPEELISCDVVDSHVMPERGEIICEKAGQYILHFDNSYSWLTTKELLYKVEKESPKANIIPN